MSKYPEQSSSPPLSLHHSGSRSNLGETLWSLLGTELDEHHKGNNNHLKSLLKNNLHSNGQVSSLTDTLINNKLNEMLPNLDSLTPNQVLQQLLQNHHTQKNVQQQQQDPGMYNKNLMNSDDSYQNDKNRKYLLNKVPYFEPGTTTIVSPKNGFATPIVQVIHFPINSYQENQGKHPPSQKMQGHLNHYDEDQGNSHYQHQTNWTPRPTPPYESDYGENRMPVYSSYMQSQTTSNSSITSPPNGTTAYSSPAPIILQTSRPPSESEENIDEVNGDEDPLKSTDSRINFSYHPILEYIVN